MGEQVGPRAALDGVRVLDLGQIYNGTYCGMILAHLGADVVKVEPPAGESLRWRAKNGMSYPFLLLNANKRSIAVDLKATEGREIFLRLVAEADVLIENFRPGVMARLGLEYGMLSRENPRLVYASGRGYGTSGGHRDLPAMDLTLQASTGVMSVTGFPDGPPLKAGVAVADFLAGTHLVAGVLAALVQRSVTRRGQHVEVAMEDALLPALTSNLAGLFEHGPDFPERTGNRHGSLSIAPYNVYPTQDGWLTIFCTGDRHWVALCKAMARPDLADHPRYQDQYGRAHAMDEIDAVVSAWTSQLSTEDCLTRLMPAGVPAAPVRTLADVANDDSWFERGMMMKLDMEDLGERLTFGSPIFLSDSPAHVRLHPPKLAADTAEVLADWLDLAPAELDDLFEGGAISRPADVDGAAGGADSVNSD